MALDPRARVRTVREEEGIASIVLASPATANALDRAMADALVAAFDTLGRQSETRVILLEAEGDTFSSGAPRELLEQLIKGEAEPSDITLPRVLLACPVPVIAVVSGHAVGGGFALALAADLIYLARDRRYGFTFMNLGFTPGMGTTRLCEHVLSPALAHELLYTGALRRGADFERTGVNGVFPSSVVRARAFDVARRIARQPRTALELLKQALALPRRTAFEQALAHESLMHRITMRDGQALARIEEGYQ